MKSVAVLLVFIASISSAAIDNNISAKITGNKITFFWASKSLSKMDSSLGASLLLGSKLKIVYRNQKELRIDLGPISAPKMENNYFFVSCILKNVSLESIDSLYIITKGQEFKISILPAADHPHTTDSTRSPL